VVAYCSLQLTADMDGQPYSIHTYIYMIYCIEYQVFDHFCEMLLAARVEERYIYLMW
jgi:hypothetical protein